MLTFISNHNDVSEVDHLQKLKSELKNADVISLCSGHLKLDGVTQIASDLTAAVERGARVVIYSNRKHTKKDVASKLAELNIEHVIVDDKRLYLHTKLFFVKSGDRYSAFVGSANITKGGLTSNDELSVIVSGTMGDRQHSELTHYLAQLDARCRANQVTRTTD